ncbi:ferritin [Candidatus Woesearchaeota archaeon]|nr:ferritin [Candidatus Woesearchaeota archaeon]
MKISKKIQDALNGQINKELYSAYVYMSMAANFEQESLTGFSHWMRVQAKEELGHAMKIYQFILDRDGIIELEQISKPNGKWNSPAHIIETAYKHEQSVTQSIHNIIKIAEAEHDKATDVFLHWFVDEQVEEEANASELLDRVKLAKTGEGLLILDKQLSERKD